tara:strand:+ start:91 stop:195 length:105 start_codon:yes stop_codon:yes gene_type:complete
MESTVHSKLAAVSAASATPAHDRQVVSFSLDHGF